MKISKLLVLSALWLTASSAMAAIVDGVRQKPVPTTQGFVASADTTQNFYLYNVDAKAFFSEGNAWGTQASVAEQGLKVAFTKYSEEAPEGIYILNDFSLAKKAWKQVFFDSETAMFVDRGSQANYAWSIEAGEGTFRMYAAGDATINPTLTAGPEGVYPNSYVGLDVTENPANTALSPFLSAEEGHLITWAFVAAADYDAYVALLPAYNKAQELKAKLDEAKAMSADVAQYEAIYLNEEATVEQLEEAVAAVQQIINKAAEQNATPENPSDMTTLITNPSYDSNNNTGWSGDTPAFQSYTNAEFYQKNYNAYQDLENIPNGVYAVKVNAFFRPGYTVESFAKWPLGKDLNAKVYAKAGEDSLNVSIVNIFEGSTDEKLGVGSEYGENGTADDGQSHYVPNNMQAAEAYFEAGRYQNQLFIATDDGKLRIGLKKDDANFGGNWTIWDNWQLTYYGNTAAAFKFWVDEAKKQAADYSSLPDSIVYTAAYLDAYNKVLAEATASNKAEAIAAIANIDSAAAAINKNIELWEQLAAVAADATKVGADKTLDPKYTGDLADWAGFDYAEDILPAKALTNEELEKLIAEKQAEIDEARKHPFGAGADMTNLLKNPNFQEGEKGWTGFRSQASPLMPVTGGPSNNLCAEAWNTTSFDLYQVVEGAPVGVYEISVQGFYRYGRGDVAYNHHKDQDVDEVKPGGAPCFVYMNAKATPFQNVFDEPVAVAEDFYSTQKYTSPDGEYVFPDGMISAGEAYSRGMYTQRAYGLVAKEGDVMRVGVKGSSNQLGDSWVIFDNFKLTYQGYQADVIKPVVEEEITKAEALQAQAMGKDVYQALTKAIDDAKATLEQADGKVMFDALSDLFDAEANVSASVAIFKELVAANANMEKEMEAAANQTALAAAGELNEQIKDGIENYTYEDADVPGLLKQIAELITKMRLPDTADASDLAPVDVTSVIKNATYDEGVDGWSGTAAAWGGDKGALAELFNKNYDYYQDIPGLPAGTYEVGVQAFYRAGSAVNDYTKIDSLEYSYAFLYAAAIAGTDTLYSSKAIERLGLIVDFEGYQYKECDDSELADYALVKTDTIKVEGADDTYKYTWLPNMMNTANDYFLNGYFTGNKVVVKIAEGETLRIGLQKNVHLDNDWTIFDGWTLTYYGTASEKQADGNPMGIETIGGEAAPVKVEFFSLDGRKTIGVQKGIVIVRQTLSDGRVVVKKMRK